MTVKELINYLSDYLDDTEVVIDKEYGNGIEYDIQVKLVAESRENGIEDVVVLY